jgi:hypothetical protein
MNMRVREGLGGEGSSPLPPSETQSSFIYIHIAIYPYIHISIYPFIQISRYPDIHISRYPDSQIARYPYPYRSKSINIHPNP